MGVVLIGRLRELGGCVCDGLWETGEIVGTS